MPDNANATQTGRQDGLVDRRRTRMATRTSLFPYDPQTSTVPSPASALPSPMTVIRRARRLRYGRGSSSSSSSNETARPSDFRGQSSSDFSDEAQGQPPSEQPQEQPPEESYSPNDNVVELDLGTDSTPQSDEWITLRDSLLDGMEDSDPQEMRHHIESLIQAAHSIPNTSSEGVVDAVNTWSDVDRGLVPLPYLPESSEALSVIAPTGDDHELYDHQDTGRYSPPAQPDENVHASSSTGELLNNQGGDADNMEVDTQTAEQVWNLIETIRTPQTHSSNLSDDGASSQYSFNTAVDGIQRASNPWMETHHSDSNPLPPPRVPRFPSESRTGSSWDMPASPPQHRAAEDHSTPGFSSSDFTTGPYGPAPDPHPIPQPQPEPYTSPTEPPSQDPPATRNDLLLVRDCIEVLTQAVTGMSATATEWIQEQRRHFAGPTRTSRRSGRSPVMNSDDGGDADTEDDFPPRRRTGAVKHRPAKKNRLNCDVRRHTVILMSERQDSHLPPIPTADEVEDWNPRRRRACTAENFRPDINSPPGTPWNKSVTEVFVDSFFDSDIYEQYSRESVRKAFSAHLRSLRRAEQRRISSQEARAAIAARARRDERKRNLFGRRLRTAKRYPDLRRHIEMLMYLGVDGVSTDESDHENSAGLPTYRVVKKPWRNPSLEDWYRVFDALHRHSRFRPVRRATRGAQAHIRLPGSGVDGSRAAVPQLPVSAYNPDWLEVLNENDLADLLVNQEDGYDWSHTAEILELAQQNIGLQEG